MGFKVIITGAIVLNAIGCGFGESGSSTQGSATAAGELSARMQDHKNDVRGNGGDAVVCFSSESIREAVRERLLANRHSDHPVNPFEDGQVMRDIASIEILDAYEYRMRIDFPPVERELIDIDSATFIDYLPRLIDKIKTKSRLGHRLDQTLEELPLSSWTQSPGVVAIDDSDHSHILPRECLLVQIAVRRDNVVYYDRHLFDHLDEFNRLVLVVHELVYKIGEHHANSRYARQAVGFLLSQEFDDVTPLEAMRRLQPFGSYGFPMQIWGQEVWVSHVAEDGGGRIVAGKVYEEVTISRSGYTYTLTDSSLYNTSFRFDLAGEVVYLGSAKVVGPFFGTIGLGEVHLHGELPTRIDSEGGITVQTSIQDWTHVSEVVVASDGRIEELATSTSSSRANTTEIDGFDIRVGGRISFFPGGNDIHLIEKATGSYDWEFDPIHVEGALEFFPSGALKRCGPCQPFSGAGIEFPSQQVQIPGAIHFEIIFRESAELEKIKVLHRSGGMYGFRWRRGRANRLREVHFDLGHVPSGLVFANRHGEVYYDQDSDGVLESDPIVVGEVTLELNPDGSIRNLP